MGELVFKTYVRRCTIIKMAVGLGKLYSCTTFLEVGVQQSLPRIKKNKVYKVARILLRIRLRAKTV